MKRSVTMGESFCLSTPACPAVVEKIVGRVNANMRVRVRQEGVPPYPRQSQAELRAGRMNTMSRRTSRLLQFGLHRIMGRHEFALH